MASPASGPISYLHRTIVLCYGTRPQIIKASRLAAALSQKFHLVRVDTGQHYDQELSAVHYAELGVSPPDHFLEVGSGPLPEQTALITSRVAELLTSVRPDAVVVIGDTISTLGGALAAALLRIPIVHVEAGLRATRREMTEDVVRRVVDDMSPVLCAPSARPAEQLRVERQAGRVVQTGDVAYDVPGRPWSRRGMCTVAPISRLDRGRYGRDHRFRRRAARGLLARHTTMPHNPGGDGVARDSRLRGEPTGGPGDSPRRSGARAR